MNTETQPSPHPDDVRLAALAADPNARELPLCEKIRLIASLLAAWDPQGFERLDGLTWPEGQAILLCRCQHRLRESNPYAAIKPVLRSSFHVDTGHDTIAAQRLIEMMMRSLGYGPGTISQVKTMLKPSMTFEAALKTYL